MVKGSVVVPVSNTARDEARCDQTMVDQTVGFLTPRLLTMTYISYGYIHRSTGAMLMHALPLDGKHLYLTALTKGLND